MFGIKDVFTTINLLGGVVGLCLCIDGEPYWAGVAVMLGYGFGDTLDGWVARRLGSANAFGSEYDTIADHAAHCIAPAAVVYVVYNQAALLSSPWASKCLAIALAATIIVVVSIRHARNAALPIAYRGVWGGLPRSVFGFTAIGYVNGAVTPMIPGGLWWGVLLIPLLAVVTLTRLPFANHRIPRGHELYVRVLIAMCFLTVFAVAIFCREFLFDSLFAWMIFYSLFSWKTLTRAERSDYGDVVDSARSVVSA